MDECSLLILRNEIAELEQTLTAKKRRLQEVCAARAEPQALNDPLSAPAIRHNSPPAMKIALFRSLFKGREDVFAKRFESKKTGKSGYLPACQNEWARGICDKTTGCNRCARRVFIPLGDDVIADHLGGHEPFVIGVYPLLLNETCHFLAVDFDKAAWREDAGAFMATCAAEGIPAALERSRSGNGAHIWIFFDKPVPAVKARKLGSFLMTRTLDRRPEIGMDSFDRFFPNQDTLPKGGLGNLIALPLQKAARANNNSVFLDDTMTPYHDQWAFLDSVRRVDESMLNICIQKAAARDELLPIVSNAIETEDEAQPWQQNAADLPKITAPLPEKAEIVLANQIYIAHAGLPPELRKRIMCLASFSNPEFYKAQRMRLSTWDKPRILCCYEFFPGHIGLPAGCLSGLIAILDHYHIKPEIQDKQNRGRHIDVDFLGELREEQAKAAPKLLASNMGILAASTAFGKTVAALWMIANRKVNTVILVHRKVIAEQWQEQIHRFLGITAGYYSGKKKERTGIIDIVVMQSVIKKDTVADWISDYGQVIVDECHHIPAASFERIIRKCPAYYRLGLTATVKRKDGQHPIILMNLGEILHTDTRVVTPFAQKLFPRHTNFTMPDIPYRNGVTESLGVYIQDIYRTLSVDEDRNRLIIQDILGAYHAGRECLVISDRLDHLEILRDALADKVSSLFVLRGGLTAKQTAAVMDALRNAPPNAPRVLLATGKYLGEGFDLPGLDTLFLVFPFSWKGMLIQYTGRLNRASQGKKEIHVYDYVDNKVPVLAGMYTKRQRGYRTMGFAEM